SPVSVLQNLQSVSAPNNPEWNPRSAHGEQPDSMTLRAALLESNNAAAVDLQQEIGTRSVLKLASDSGLNGLPGLPSLSRGTGLVSPLELTVGYSMFPTGGEVARPRPIQRVLDADGSSVLDHPIDRERIMSPEVAFQMTTMLRDVVERGTGSAARA